MKQKQKQYVKQSVVVNIGKRVPLKEKKAKEPVKKKSKKPKKSRYVNIIKPITTLKPYEPRIAPIVNTITPLPTNYVTVYPSPAPAPLVIRALPDTEHPPPLPIAPRTPVRVPTNLPDTEHALLRDEEPVSLGGVDRQSELFQEAAGVEPVESEVQFVPNFESSFYPLSPPSAELPFSPRSPELPLSPPTPQRRPSPDLEEIARQKEGRAQTRAKLAQFIKVAEQAEQPGAVATAQDWLRELASPGQEADVLRLASPKEQEEDQLQKRRNPRRKVAKGYSPDSRAPVGTPAGFSFRN